MNKFYSSLYNSIYLKLKIIVFKIFMKNKQKTFLLFKIIIIIIVIYEENFSENHIDTIDHHRITIIFFSNNYC